MAVLHFALAATLTAAEPPDYVRDVQPILKKYCVQCHNADDREGKLVLESHEQLMQGGKSGAAVTPGEADASRMMRLVTGRSKPRMPPEDHAAPKAEDIEVLKNWIAAGAKGGDGKPADPFQLVVPKITVRAKPAAAILSLAASPDGKLLAAGKYGAVDLFSLGDKRPLKTLSGHRGNVSSVSFSPDGALLLAAAGEPGLAGELRVWNTADWSPIRVLTGHRDSFYRAVASPDGRWLAAGGYDGRISLWDRTSGELKVTMSGHSGAVFDLAFHPQRPILASASGDRTVKLWRLPDGQRLETFVEPQGEQAALAFSPDGERLAAAGADRRIRVWRLSETAKEGTNKLLLSRFAHEGAVLSLVWTSDGKRLVSTAADRTTKTWDAADLALGRSLPPAAGWAPPLAVLPGGERAAVARQGGTWEIIGLAEEKSTASAPLVPLSETVPQYDYGVQPAIDQLPKTAEVEPNDTPDSAQRFTIPGVVTGRLFSDRPGATDAADFHRFTAKKGDQWIVEVNAARSGSPLDSRIAVLSGAGRPITAVQLAVVRNSELEFRGIDSNQRGMRLANWDEMTLNQFVYLGGEVVKLYQQRQGPDSDAQVYPQEGSRLTYFGTSPRAHPLGEAAAVVVPYPSTADLGPSGLSVIALPYENDDDGRRMLGTDSSLLFTAPADGEYLVRVGDARGFSGEKFTYQLIVRRPQPDFSVTLEGGSAAVSPGSGKELKFRAVRNDYYEGDIRVELRGLPVGWSASSPVVISRGQQVAASVLAAAPDAPPLTAEQLKAVSISATARIFAAEKTKPVGGLGEIKLADKPKLLVTLAANGSPRPPVAPARAFTPLKPEKVTSAGGSVLTLQPDQSLLASGPNPDRETYTISATLPAGAIHALRLEALGDKSLPASAPGRAAPNGNFVLTEIALRAAPKDKPGEATSVAIAEATVDYAQGGFSAAALIDGNPKTGWAVAVNDEKKTFPVQRSGETADHFAVLEFKTPLVVSTPTVLTVTLAHDSDVKQHSLGRFRLATSSEPRPRPVLDFPPAAEVTLTAGSSTTCTLRVERRGLSERISFDVNNLPHGVIVDHIGLNGVLIPEGESERELVLSAESWVEPTDRLFHAVAKVDGNQVSLPMLLHIRPPAPR